MKWEKKGIVFQPDNSLWWSRKYALYPTPYYLEQEHVIRVYFSSVDDNVFGRVSFVDLDASDPSQIKFNPGYPILDIGEEGTFEDCGACPSQVMMVDDQLRMYYSGYC